MQITQFNTIIENDDIDAFMEYFGFDFPEDDAKPDYLEKDWYKFSLDRSIKSHRTKDVKISYGVLSPLTGKLQHEYQLWIWKHRNLYNSWVSKLDAEKRLPDAESKLTKPLYEYARNNHGECNVSKARKVQVLQKQLSDAKYRIALGLEISDTLPLPDSDIEGFWNNLQYVIQVKEDGFKIKAEKESKKRPRNKKGNFKTNCFMKMNTYYDFDLLAGDLLTAIKDMNAGTENKRENVQLPFGMVQVKMFKSYLRLVGKQKIRITPLDNGFTLATFDGMKSTWLDQDKIWDTPICNYVVEFDM